MGKKGIERALLVLKQWLARAKWPAPGATIAWVLAANLILLSLILRLLLELLSGEPLPVYITFYPAVVLAALVGGPVIGIVTSLSTLAISWAFFRSVPSASVSAAVIYGCTSMFLGWVVGTARLSFERAKAVRKEHEYAARESVHRIKNLIAVVQAIIRKVFREVETVEQYRDILSERMNGLAVAQSVLIQQDWQDVPLAVLIDSALAPFLPNPGLKVRRGAEVTIPARCVRGLSMALYELCTNAMKYGALAEGRGPVSLTWTTSGEHTVLDWEEKTTADPQRGVGFGATLIRFALAEVRDGHVDYRVTPDGVYASFRWPSLTQASFRDTHERKRASVADDQLQPPNSFILVRRALNESRLLFPKVTGAGE